MPAMTAKTRLPAHLLFVALLAAVLMVAAGCGSQPAPTATPTKTPVPTATPPPPTPTPAPTDTPAPTPTDTPNPTPTATVTPEATVMPTAVPGGVSVTERYPDLCPFTGLPPTDPADLQRRPLAIKVANQKSVNPQSGLSEADVVVESRVEFSETRYTAIYHCTTSDRVGSIRSARLIDLDLPVIFDAVLAFSGGVQPVRQKIYESDLGKQVLEQALNGPSFVRDTTIRVPDNLFASTATLWRTVASRAWVRPLKPSAGWAYSVEPPPGGQPATQADIPYPRFAVRWNDDAGAQRWLRSMGGAPHIDRTTGEQISAANVVILGANHVTTLIVEHGTGRQVVNGNCVNCSIEIQLWGEGPATILRDGQRYTGKWLRPERHAPFRFVDANGNDIPLKPGNTWWQVVPLEMSVTYE